MKQSISILLKKIIFLYRNNRSERDKNQINALLTYNTPDLLEELLTARSDHHRIKRKLYTSISSTGELYEVTEEDKKMDKVGGTLELKNIYMQTLGLMIH